MKKILILIIILLLSLILNILLFTRYKFNDQRDMKVFNKTSSHTLISFVIYLILNIILEFIKGTKLSFASNSPSFMNLLIISFLFLINQLIYRKDFSKKS